MIKGEIKEIIILNASVELINIGHKILNKALNEGGEPYAVNLAGDGKGHYLKRIKKEVK